MAQAARDGNFVPTLLGVSNADGTTPVAVYANPSTHRLLVDLSGGGSGDVVGPGSATDNAIARFDGATGKLIQNSVVLVADTTGAITGTESITVGVTGAGTGTILLKGTTSGTITIQPASAAGTYTLTLPLDDGTPSQFLQTNGSGVLTWATVSAAAGGADTQVQYNNSTALGGITGATSNGTTLTITAGRATTDFSPSSNDAAALGTTALGWSDAFFATGAVINIANGNWVATHTSAILTVGTGDLRVTTAGTNTASVVTVGGTQTLTAKTLTSPTIITSPTAAGATWTDLGTVTTADINGGTIDGSVIGGASAAAITGTLITGNSFVPNLSTIPTNGMYLPAANTLGWGINSAAEMQLTGTALSPGADGGSSLGTTALGWQNLFGNTGFVLNIENSDWVATHTAGILTVGTGDLRVTTAGTNSASVVTVGGTQTLTAKTLTSPTLTTPAAFTTGGTITLAENSSIALDPAGSADGKYTGITVTATSGYTQAFGDLVYLAVADSRWEAADADAASTSGSVQLAMVVSTGTDGNPCTLLLQGIIRADAKFPALTVGAPVYASTTTGEIQVAQPSGTDDVIRVVGFALTADEIYFNPSGDYITHT